MNLDLSNPFNADAVIIQISQFGTAWLRPTSVIQARFLKFMARIDFGERRTTNHVPEPP